MKKVLCCKSKEINVTVFSKITFEDVVLTEFYNFDWTTEEMLNHILSAHKYKKEDVIDFRVSVHSTYKMQ